MSNVTLIVKIKPDEVEMQVLERFKEFQQAMIDKDESILNEIMDDNYTLTHMSGKVQSKQEYIQEITNGVLNYYHSTIMEPTITITDDRHAKLTADVKLDAKVYGIKGNWTLKTNVTMKKIDDVWYLSKWDN